MSVAVCVDVGSTFTKAAAVDLATGRLLATASHATTSGTDVLHGLDAAVAALHLPPDRASGPAPTSGPASTSTSGPASASTSGPASASTSGAAEVLVCSSAGGGLRLAVVGYEAEVSAEAGFRVGLSAGARVVHVAAGRLDRAAVAELRAAAPDIVLLVGGTDGGDEEVLRHNARALATARPRFTVVVAGNEVVRDEALAMLGPTAVGAPNVLPRIGELNPFPARGALRELFLRHVIGGKRLSRGRRFASLVRGATPDLVLTGVELWAEAVGGDLLVVDVGGATTDVYSVLAPDPQAPAGERDVAGTLWHSRTVEGDLGVRWSAPSVVAAAGREGLLDPDERRSLVEAAARRAADPGFLPDGPAAEAVELRLAELAATIAIRRHARGDTGGTMGGGTMGGGTVSGGTVGGGGVGGARHGRRDLSRVRWVIGSGGALRHQPGPARAALARVLTDHAGGWALPREAGVAIDERYVLAAAGLLATNHRRAATALLLRQGMSAQ